MTWTVISFINHSGIHSNGVPLAAIQGCVDAYGIGVHTATVDADTADDAMNTVREAFRIVGSARANAEDYPPYATRWTVIGTRDNGVCATSSVLAVIGGEHKVEGTYGTMLSHRWDLVVDAKDHREAAERADDENRIGDNETW